MSKDQKTVSKLATVHKKSRYGAVHKKTSGVTMVRLPKALLDKNPKCDLKHGERFRVKISPNGNSITLIRMGRGKKAID